MVPPSGTGCGCKYHSPLAGGGALLLVGRRRGIHFNENELHIVKDVQSIARAGKLEMSALGSGKTDLATVLKSLDGLSLWLIYSSLLENMRVIRNKGVCFQGWCLLCSRLRVCCVARRELPAESRGR